jgi:phage shock protein PspC (stress-responsive transcriptional regulator)
MINNFFRKVSNIIFLTFGFLFSFFIFSSSLSASNSEGLMASVQDPFGTGKEDIKLDAAKDGDLKSNLITIINYLLLFLGFVLLAIILYAGVLIIMSNGNAEEVTKGKDIIMYALLGVIVIVLSYTIVNFITDVASSGENQ